MEVVFNHVCATFNVHKGLFWLKIQDQVIQSEFCNN